MKLSDFPTYDTNPFNITGVVMKLIVAKGEVFEVANTGTGELELFQRAGKTVDYAKDTLQFTKVYAGAINDIKDFTTPALKLWCYIIENVGISSDEIYIDAQSVMTYGEYNSKSPVYKGLCELIKKQFIAKKIGTNLYFINPDKFFNGRRKI